MHFELDPVLRAVMTHIPGAVSAKQVLHVQGVLANSVVRLPLVEPTEPNRTGPRRPREAGWDL